MKQGIRMVWGVLLMMWMATGVTRAQKVDEERMERDIEVAENVLSTLIKQKFDKRSAGFFPLEARGTYMAGYGITLRIPSNFTDVWYVTEDVRGAVIVGEGTSYSYSYNSDNEDEGGPGVQVRRRGNRMDRDSLANLYTQKVIEAGKEFLADYGDLISQLTPEERITITNRDENNNRMFFPGMKTQRQSMITLEAAKGDISQLRQGRITREQFMNKLKIVNTSSVEESDPDLELLSSILSRLYRQDLSKTYYTNENVYYERLKDFGAIFYMTVYSSEETGYRSWRMPTQHLDDLDQAARDKKVTELYPQFEKELKENFLEYGRTLRSLKELEVLMLNVRLTKCKQCGIPSTLELSVKNDVIKQFNSGQLSKDAALAKISVKKGPAQ